MRLNNNNNHKTVWFSAPVLTGDRLQRHKTRKVKIKKKTTIKTATKS